MPAQLSGWISLISPSLRDFQKAASKTLRLQKFCRWIVAPGTEILQTALNGLGKWAHYSVSECDRL